MPNYRTGAHKVAWRAAVAEILTFFLSYYRPHPSLLRTFIAYAERMLFYWAGPYHGQLEKGKGYTDLRPVISIHILGFCLLPQRQRFRHFHHLFEVRERRTGYRLTDHLQLHTLELPKFDKQMAELATPEDRWVYFLENADIMTTEQVHALGVPEIDQAEEKLRVISQDRELRMQYEQRMKAERDAEVREKDLMAAWLTQGRREGRCEARQQDILDILEARGLSISQAVRARVTACEDLRTLKRYLTKAAIASSAEEAVAD